jgi:fatty acid desaturase
MAATQLPDRIEWPTVALVLACTGAWMAATALAGAAPWIALPVLVLSLVLHSSLTHEAVHGHPTPSATANAALLFPALGLFVPYGRFRDLHLAHHEDATLTDPYDDPESNYLDPAVWARLPRAARALLLANNTLAGRMLLGPAIGLALFYRADLRAALAGDRAVRRAWGLHALGLVPVLLWLGLAGTVGAAAYLAAAYAALSILKIRTFLEHRAHEAARGRSVLIEDRGPLAFLFLNNNLHAVHHGHPGLAWYRLPAFYRARRERFLQMNHGYLYGSYAEIFASHFLKRKDPVPHPLYPPAE